MRSDEENVRGTAFESKASLELPRKPIFGWLIFCRLYEKGVNLPLVSPQRNGGRHRTSQPSGSPFGTAERVCFSKLKKVREVIGASLLASGIFLTFFNQLPRLIRSQLSCSIGSLVLS